MSEVPFRKEKVEAWVGNAGRYGMQLKGVLLITITQSWMASNVMLRS